MATMNVRMKVAFPFVLACLLVSASIFEAEAEISCDDVVVWLTPCISYGVLGGDVSPSCCDGIRTLNAHYNTTADIRNACSCIQEVAALIPGLDYDRANEIPAKCGTTCPYKLYPTTDCSSVG